MDDWQKVTLSLEASILEAIQVIDLGGVQIALVVDDFYRLLGTVTDGDIRRGILKGIPLEEKVGQIMNKNPVVAREFEGESKIVEIMRKHKLYKLPVVASDRRVVALETIDDLVEPKVLNNWVVLMAGGQGSRLRPLTYYKPKPLLNVGGKPILETIVRNFAEQGFKKFFISIGYKAAMVKNAIGDGSSLGVEIAYLEENRPLGTAGALSLLPSTPSEPLLVMNTDLLTGINYRHLLAFHREHDADATMCVRQFESQIPYGVVDMDGARITGLVEKPIQQFFVNAGIYVVGPNLLEFIPENTYMDMPSVFEQAVREDKVAVAFAIRENWIDIGNVEDYERAKSESEIFKPSITYSAISSGSSQLES